MQTLRPLSIGELLDRTFLEYRRHFVLFLGIAAVPGALRLALNLGGLVAQPMALGVGRAVLWAVASAIVYVVASTVAQGATMIAVSQIQLDREASAASAFRRIWPRAGELVLLSINIGVRVLLGTLLLIVPGILAALKYSLAVPALILEEVTISESLDRSRTLTAGHRGRIFVIYLLLAVLSFIATAVWQTPAMLLVEATLGRVRPDQLPFVARVTFAFCAFASQTLVAPVMTIALALVYYDERIRKEAFDLEHMMGQIDAAAVSPAPLA